MKREKVKIPILTNEDFWSEVTELELAASSSRTARYSYPLVVYTTYSGLYSEKPSSPRILSPLFPCVPYGTVGRNVVVTPNNFAYANSMPYLCRKYK